MQNIAYTEKWFFLIVTLPAFNLATVYYFFV